MVVSHQVMAFGPHLNESALILLKDDCFLVSFALFYDLHTGTFPPLCSNKSSFQKNNNVVVVNLDADGDLELFVTTASLVAPTVCNQEPPVHLHPLRGQSIAGAGSGL